VVLAVPQHNLPPGSMRPMTIATIVDQPADVILTSLSNCGEWYYRPESRRRPKVMVGAGIDGSGRIAS